MLKNLFVVASLLTGVTLVIFLLGGSAFALNHDRVSFDVKKEIGVTTPSNILGSLNCRMGEVNTGQPCNLTFIENNTGRVFGLTQNLNEAMRLYHSGNRNVAIEGTINGDTIEVNKIQAL